MDEEVDKGERTMKYSKLTVDERKWFANECCKVRQRLRVGHNKNFTQLEKDLINYMELYEALQDRKKKICDKYFEQKK